MPGLAKNTADTDGKVGAASGFFVFILLCQQANTDCVQCRCEVHTRLSASKRPQLNLNVVLSQKKKAN